jgi:preprotein translocase subunit SecE
MSTENKKPSLTKISNYLREAKSELKKIVWASKKQIINNSLLVVGAIVVTGLLVSLIDYLFTSGVQAIINIFK